MTFLWETHFSDSTFLHFKPIQSLNINIGRRVDDQNSWWVDGFACEEHFFSCDEMRSNFIISLSLSRLTTKFQPQFKFKWKLNSMKINQILFSFLFPHPNFQSFQNPLSILPKLTSETEPGNSIRMVIPTITTTIQARMQGRTQVTNTPIQVMIQAMEWRVVVHDASSDYYTQLVNCFYSDQLSCWFTSWSSMTKDSRGISTVRNNSIYTQSLWWLDSSSWMVSPCWCTSHSDVVRRSTTRFSIPSCLFVPFLP